jgi:segregation and condensation protein B
VKASQIVEGVLFASDAPLKAEEIARADESLDEDRVEEAIRELRTLYDETERAFQIVELGEGYQILTRAEFAPYLERFDTVPKPSRLSGPALETLAIIAYRQPIGRIEVEYIRGVGSSGVIRTLQDRDLIDVVGRGEGIGRPLLYGTTKRFLEHFGFFSLDALPRPEELPVVLKDRAPLEDLLGEEAREGQPEGGANGLQEGLFPPSERAASEGADGPPGGAVSKGEGSTDPPGEPVAETEGLRDDPGEEEPHV